MTTGFTRLEGDVHIGGTLTASQVAFAKMLEAILQIQNVSSSVTLEQPNVVYNTDTASQGIEATLPDAADNDGWLFVVKNAGVNIMGVVTTGADTIDGQSSIILTPDGFAVSFLSTDGEWKRIAQFAEKSIEGLGLGFRPPFKHTSATFTEIGEVTKSYAIRDSTDTFTIKWVGRFVLDITKSGAGGLDTGAEAADTWYSAWVIADTTGVESVAGIMTTSPTAPTLPSGYDVKALVGWVRNDAGSDLRRFIESACGDKRVYRYDTDRADLLALSSGSATAFTTVDLAEWMPPSGSDIAQILIEIDTNAADQSVSLRPPASTEPTPPVRVKPGFSTSPEKVSTILEAIIEGRAIDYAASNAGANVDLYILGFDLCLEF